MPYLDAALLFRQYKNTKKIHYDKKGGLGFLFCFTFDVKKPPHKETAFL